MRPPGDTQKAGWEPLLPLCSLPPRRVRQVNKGLPPEGPRAQVGVYTPEGECLAAFQAYSGALGVKSLAWSPSGQLLAVGSYDQVRPAVPLQHLWLLQLRQERHGGSYGSGSMAAQVFLKRRRQGAAESSPRRSHRAQALTVSHTNPMGC